MRTARLIGLAAFVMVIAAAGVAQAQTQDTAARTRPNLILRAELMAPNQRGVTLLEMVRKRLAVVVRSGRFNTEDGPVTLCVYARRSAAQAAAEPAREGLDECPMIAAYVDGVRISNAGAFLESVEASLYESIELLSAADAALRYGLSANGREVLILWNEGRGPYAPKR